MTFSIIVPVYNVERYLRECLDSILDAAKTYNMEIVCIDDGSTDSSGSILDEYAQRDSRFVIIHQQNGGEGAARNTGLKVAKGDWILFFDSDDVVAPETLQAVSNAIEKNANADLIRFGTSVYEDGKSPVWSGNGVMREVDISLNIPDEFSMYGITEMAYRKDVISGLEFRPYVIGADIVFTSSCFARAKNVISINSKFYGYRLRSGSMAHSALSSKKIRDHIDFLREQFQNFNASGKSLAQSFARSRMNAWIEQSAFEIMVKLSEVNARDELLDYWFKSLSDALSLPYLTPWQRFVTNAIRLTHSKVLMRMLCIAPYQLKINGLFRR